jgi:uncharacterized membrane protein
MSAQDTAEIAPEYSNTAGKVSDGRYTFLSGLAGVATRPAAWVALFTVVGLAVRLYRLDARGFWFDEVAFAYSVRLDTPTDVLHLNSLFSDQSPLSFFLTWLVRGLGGSEWVVRFPFAIAGTLTIPAIYLLGRELARPRVGVVAALLFALSPFSVFYSQQVHPYAPLILFTTLQMLFAYRSASYGRWYDWASLSLSSILNLYNDYIALIISAIVALFLLTVLLGKIAGVVRYRGKEPDDGLVASATIRPVGTQLIFAVASLAAILLGYLPWLSSALKFVGDPNLGFGRLPKGAHGTFADMQLLAHGLGFDKFLVALLLVGALYVLIMMVRTWRLSCVLLFLWIALPLASFWLRVGDAMLLLKVAYYSFLFPAAVIVIALGVECLVQIGAQIYLRFSLARTPALQRTGAHGSRTFSIVSQVLYAALLAPALIQTSVGMAASYSAPNVVSQDYRGVADRIIADSPASSMVLSLGMWGIKPAPEFPVDVISYYLWLRHSQIKKLDGSLLDEYTVTHIPDGAIVWGVYELPWPLAPEHVQRAVDLGLEVIPFENISLLRQRAPRGSPAEQIDTLLKWASPMEPGLISLRSMLNPQFGATALGDNILPAMTDIQLPARNQDLLNGEQQADRWVLWSGTSPGRDGKSLVLSSDGSQPMVAITLSTGKLAPGKDYALLFHYRNKDLKGEQRVFLSTYGGDWKPIDTFPYGAGFHCPPNSESASAFAFHVPASATNATLWLRITGTGTAEFSSVEIRPVK